MEKIVSLAKRRGFVFPGSEIYGGFAGTYDWGPMGAALRKNIVDKWIHAMQSHDNIALIETSIFTAPEVWEASGHATGFSDPLVICNNCQRTFRADHLLEERGIVADEKMSEQELNTLFDTVRDTVICPVCNKKDFGQIVQKNLMATATLGKLSDEDKDVYLRAETAQSTYINYKNVLDTGMYKVPFGIAQVGKVFRNEISPRQFLFRKREFEQMEMQYFVAPEDAAAAFEKWKKERMDFYEEIGIRPDMVRYTQHDNLVFYAKDAWDIEYHFPFGWAELEGVHNRGDYDLTQHQTHSGVDLSVLDQDTHKKYIPHVIETAVGVDRMVLAVLADAYDEDQMGEGTRVVLRLKAEIAPVKVAVFPLMRNKPELVEKAREIYTELKKTIPHVMFDDNGNVGKRYRRQDEIGTPWCVTVDFDTLEDNTVTVRDRDTGEQKRIALTDLIMALGY